MLTLLEIAEFGAVKTLIVSIPESIGLLAFGVGLVVLAVFIRSILTRGDVERKPKGDEKLLDRR